MGRGQGHYCGAPRKGSAGTCRIYLVNYDHCYHHRQWLSLDLGPHRPSLPQPARHSQRKRQLRIEFQVASANLLSEVVTKDVNDALAGRVTDYLGRLGKANLRRRAWDAERCADLAAAAKAVYALRDRAHEIVVEAIGNLLPSRTSTFSRQLAHQLLGKFVTLPIDAKLAAVARGLLLMGIFKCLATHTMTVTQCACLRMRLGEVVHADAQQQIKALLAASERDLEARRR